MKINEVEAAVGVTKKNIRFYEYLLQVPYLDMLHA